MATYPATSSIAMALAGKTQSVDIPKPHDSGVAAPRDTLTAVPGASGKGGEPAMLPTPPNSVSPSFHPQFFKRGSELPASPPNAPVYVDSDIELQDPLETKVKPTPLVAEALNGLDSLGAITPGLLAKSYLPNILLSNGPLAIRHIMSQLTTSVPGFSRIPPTKARRLVVGALEGKATGVEGGGINGEVEFEKVGWGRWGARRRDQVNQDRPAEQTSSLERATLHPRARVEIPNARAPKDDPGHYGTSMAGDSAVFSHFDFEYDDHDMLEHEADKMSLDGEDHGYCSSSAPPEDEGAFDGDWDEADLTDEEDWAGIGAAALRARSFPNASQGGQHMSNNNRKGRGGPAYPELTKTVPGGIPIQPMNFSFPDGVGGNFEIEERTAVEALLRLGSM